MLDISSNQSFLTRTRPILEVLSGAFMISFSAVWVMLADVPPLTSAFYRVLFGFVFLFAAALINGELRRARFREILPYAFCSLAFALDLYFWHTSILYIGPGLATILGNFQVFLMALWGALFFREKLTFQFILSLPLAIFGLMMVVGLNYDALSSDYRTGILFGLLTALSYTVFLLLLRQIQSTKNTGLRFTPLMYVSLFSALFLGMMLRASGTSFVIPTVSGTFALIALGLFSQAIGWIFIATAMPKIRTSLTGLILLLQPSLSFLWDVLFFSRPTTMLQWLGVATTLTAIYLGLSRTRR